MARLPLLSWCLPLLATAASVPYSEYILAPSSRTLTAPTVHEVNGTVRNAAALTAAGASSRTSNSSAVFVGANSSVTLDFGKNIAGNVRFQVDAVSGSNEYIGISFTESSMWISPDKCDATQDEGLDDPLWFAISGPGTYTADITHQRGGFRYLNVLHNSTGSVSLSALTVNWTAVPQMSDPRDYTGYFHSSSEKLNRVWYAGAYTNQLCSIDSSTGSALRLPLSGWAYNYTIANGTAVLVDGAKRDRLVWPGDIVISGPSIFVSTNRLDAIRSGLDSLLAIQLPDGRLPYSGIPFQSTDPSNFLWSFTYHLHTLNDIYDYYLFTGDVEYLKSVWGKYKLGMAYILQFIDSSKLANVTSSADWLRFGMGGHNIEANAILYYNLNLGLKLAAVLNDTSVVSNWTTTAQGIKQAANALLWDESANLFRDNTTNTSLHPQDGNAWAIVSGLVSPSRASAISAALQARWVRPYGAPAPEAGATVSPFASGFEVQAHYLAGHPERAVELIEFMWADFMLDDPRMTNSTFIEGYSTDGSLHYAPYSNDPRVSHAHGWATGPTSALTFFGAGLQLTSAGGKTWLVKPQLGGLSILSAGYTSSLGKFSASWSANSTGGLQGEFQTPPGTSGTLTLPVTEPAKRLVLNGPGGRQVRDVPNNQSTITVTNLKGGKYTVSLV
ncbi:hypothetical protein VTN96DRAFT_5022 [Rasamsonia emersonii]